MAKEGISGMQLAKKLGIPASTFKKIRSQEITNPTLATLVPIARYFSVPLEYFLGEGDVDHYVPLLSWDEVVRFPDVPLLDRVYVGSRINYGANAYALRVENENDALFPLGSFLVVKALAIPQHRDFVILANQSGAVQMQWDKQTILQAPEHKVLGVVAEYHRELVLKSIIKEE